MNDLTFAFRQLLKNPGFTVVAVLTLALGIGANTAIFSVVNAVLLRPLSFPQPERLFVVDLKGGPGTLSAGDFEDIERNSKAFSHVAVFDTRYFNLSGDAASERITSSTVSHGFFLTLGVKPLIGRVLLPVSISRTAPIAINATVLWFTFGISVMAGLFFGLAPALQTRWSDLRASLTEGSRTSTSGLLLRRFQSFLVIFEVAVTFMLLAGAGVLLKSFYLLNQVPLGFQPEHLLTARVDLAPLKYSTPQLRNNFQEELLVRIRSFPGVQNAGVISYSVAQRTQEIGIRMALGAQGRDVLQLILSHGFRLAMLGLVLGFGGSVALTRFLAAFLYQVNPTDAFTYATATLLVAAAALMACYVPARRATRVDPIMAIRYE